MKTILLIEDNSTLKKAFGSLTKEYDWKILIPKEKTTNMKWIFDRIPDLIIADLKALNGSKVELLLYLNNEYFATVPLLLITSSRKIVANEFYRGFKYYLTRPYKIEQLAATIKEILKNTETKNPW